MFLSLDVAVRCDSWFIKPKLANQGDIQPPQASYRITTVQSHSEWIAVETTRELNAALKKLVSCDESECTLTCSRAHIGESFLFLIREIFRSGMPGKKRC